MTQDQVDALEAMSARNMNAVHVPGVGWVWIEDVRTRPFYATLVLHVLRPETNDFISRLNSRGGGD